MQAPRHSSGSRSRLQPPRLPPEAPPRPLLVSLGPQLLPLGRGESPASFQILEQGRTPLVVPSFCSSEALAATSPTSTTPPKPTLHGSNVPCMQESPWHQSAHPLFLGSSISDSAPSSASDSPTPPQPRSQSCRPRLAPLGPYGLQLPSSPSASYGLQLPSSPSAGSISRVWRLPAPTPSAPASAALQRNSREPISLGPRHRTVPLGTRPQPPLLRPCAASVSSKPAHFGLGLLPLGLVRPPAPDRCSTPPRPRSQPHQPWLAPLGPVRPLAPKLPFGLVRSLAPEFSLGRLCLLCVEAPSTDSLRPCFGCIAEKQSRAHRPQPSASNHSPRHSASACSPSASYGLCLHQASSPRPRLRTALATSMGQLQHAVSTCMGVRPFSSSSMQPPPSSTSPPSLSLSTAPEEPH